MVRILSVFLGLITGLQPVAVRVGGEVAAVELRIDDQRVGVLRGEPWEMVCDFGAEIAPHELVAVGRDRAGREIARQQQWINLPKARSEAVLTLEDNPDGPPRRAGILWHSIDRPEPDFFSVAFDGVALDVTDPRSIELPPYDPNNPHLLTAELLFGETIVRTQTVVGSVPGEEISTELTAVPVILMPRARLPKTTDMEGWFIEAEKPLRVVAVERGGVDVIMVKDPSKRLRNRLSGVQQGMSHLQTSRSPGGMFAGKMVSTELGPGGRLNLIIPVGEAASSATQPAHLFPMTPDLATSPGGIMTVATFPFVPERPLDTSHVRIADAVAVAGLAAAEKGRARAVVLITDPETVDESRFDAASVRAYLSRIHVPFLVWTPLKIRGEGPWGKPRKISTADHLVDAVEELKELLDRQSVVWLAGRHLPQRVTLSPEAEDTIRLAGAATVAADLAPPASRSAVVASVDEPRPPDQSSPETAAATVAMDQRDAQSATTFSGLVEVHTVNVHVVVTGKKGKRIIDLQREDFEIFEDGIPMEITHFVPPRDGKEAVGQGSDPSSSGRTVPSPQGIEADPLPFHLVILFDTANIRPAQRTLMVEALRGFLDGGLPASTKVMLVAQEGPIHVRQNFSGSPTQVMEGFEELMNAGHSPFEEDRQHLHGEITKVAAELEEAYSIGDPAMIASAESNRNAVLHRIRSEAETQRFQMRANLDVLRRFVSSLGGVSGRKVLVYVGDGLTLNPANDLLAGASRAEVADDQLEIERHGFGLHREADELVRQANANGVTFYTLTPPSRYATLSAAMPAPGPLGYMMAMEFTRNADIKEGVCLLSGSTGGRCQSGGSDPELLLADASEDFASTYTLAYSPGRPSDGDYHRIEIKLSRPGLNLRHRKGYVDKPREDRLFDRLSAALRFDIEDNPLGMALETEDPQPPVGDKYMVPLQLKIPVENLAFLPAISENARQFQAKLLVATMDAKGRTTGAQEFPISFDIDEDRSASGRSIVYAHRVHLTLAKGAYRVAIGFWDEIGQVASILTRELQVGAMVDGSQ